MKNKIKNENGVTITALIITIIVLIVLTAISIKAVVETDLIEFSTNATLKYLNSQVEEEKKINKFDNFVHETLNEIEDKIK